MKLSKKLNTGFGLILFIPLVVVTFGALFYYTEKSEQEAQAKLAADLKVAQFILQNTVNEFRGLASAYAGQQSFAVLIEYWLQPKLDNELKKIQRTAQLDMIRVFSVQEGLLQPYTHQALSTETAVSGVEIVDAELTLAAAAPVYNRNRILIGVLLIRRMLKNTHLVSAIRQETDVDIFISPDGIMPDSSSLTMSRDIWDIQGQPLAKLIIRRSKETYRVTKNAVISVLALLGISGIVLGAAFHSFIMKYLLQPVLVLKNMADQIAQGNYAARVNLSGNDELAELSKHFNVMAKQIQTSLQQCRQFNKYLEKTVASRTNELQQKNQELQEALRELKTAQKRLIVRERLASLGELATGISHELKNPLGLVSNFSEILHNLMRNLRKELAKDHPEQKVLDYLFEKLPECVQKIQKHNERAFCIIDGMLVQSRAQKGERRLTNVNQLVREYAALAYYGIRAKNCNFDAALQEEYAPGLEQAVVSMIPQDMSRVILNIVLNAYHELGRKQKTAKPGYKPTLWICTEETIDEVVIRIRDNGDGIPEKFRDKIFQPFFSTKASEEGTGLGLSIAYDIVTHIHQGLLEVESQVGMFTEFIIRLPKA